MTPHPRTPAGYLEIYGRQDSLLYDLPYSRYIFIGLQSKCSSMQKR